MAVRSSVSQLYRHLSPSSIPKVAATSTRHATSKTPHCQNRSMATIVPPVTQDATSSRGPTAMVFMNMGGPSTTDEVGDFLSRLFVSFLTGYSLIHPWLTPEVFTGRCRSHPTRPPPILPWTSHLQPPNTQNKETICSHRWRFSNT